MVEGESGILASRAAARAADLAPEHRQAAAARRRRWRSSYSGATPAGCAGRSTISPGPTSWPNGPGPRRRWDNLQMGLRLGDDPRAVVTTTPRAGAAAAAAGGRPGDGRRRGGRTCDNPLSARRFLDRDDDRLWRHAARPAGARRRAARAKRRARCGRGRSIEQCRCPMPRRERDRPGRARRRSAGERGRRCLRDRGVRAAERRPGGGAGGCQRRRAAAARAGRGAVAGAAEAWAADRVIAEANNGGEMVEDVLRAVEPGLPVRLVHARARQRRPRRAGGGAVRSAARACSPAASPSWRTSWRLIAAGGTWSGRSPDRADAMVWALTELVLRAPAEPRVRGL